MKYGRFEVTCHFNYRGRSRGERFEAKVTPQIERGVARGHIVLVEEIVPAVPPGYTLPRGWPPSGGRTQTIRGARKAPLSLGEE